MGAATRMIAAWSTLESSFGRGTGIGHDAFLDSSLVMLYDVEVQSLPLLATACAAT